jgi:hypothetical protein
MEYEEELKKIQHLRSAVFRLDVVAIVILVLAVALQLVIPFAAPVLGVVLFFYFYKKLAYVAHYPCPRCGSPFGTKSNIVLGVGGDSCQNCGLSIRTQ